MFLDKMNLSGMSQEVIAQVMKTADPNGDGELDYKELMTVLKQTKRYLQDEKSRHQQRTRAVRSFNSPTATGSARNAKRKGALLVPV